MSTRVAKLSFQATEKVRDTCLCLHAHRAGRALARLFDDAFRPLGLTHGQFSLMMFLNQPCAPVLGALAAMLGTDRTTLTANLKPLERDGFVKSLTDAKDRRVRRVALTSKGHALLARAMPIWIDTHHLVEREAHSADMDAVRHGLTALQAGITRQIGPTD